VTLTFAKELMGMATETDAEAMAPKFQGVRRHRRYLFSVPVQLHHLVGDRKKTTHGISLEVSEGGMSAVVEGELLIGEIADIDVPLPAGRLETLAIVRHKTAGHFGFEFLGLKAEERQRLNESTKVLLPHRGSLLGTLGL
jgi:PilZ domain-containing protein